jgi:hypothetical protein
MLGNELLQNLNVLVKHQSIIWLGDLMGWNLYCMAYIHTESSNRYLNPTTAFFKKVINNKQAQIVVYKCIQLKFQIIKSYSNWIRSFSLSYMIDNKRDGPVGS